MIFITVGSQKNQFNRLLKALDEQIEEKKISETVFAQTGYSDYTPHNYSFKNFISRSELNKFIEEAELVITHGGTGSIMNALKSGKPVIAVPRRKDLGEHIDDHQFQMTNELAQMGLIICCKNTDDLYKLICETKNRKEDSIKPYISCTDKYLKSIEKYIEENV